MIATHFPPLLGKSLIFPDINEALTYRQGLVAIGGDLSTERLLAAYNRGIFPWFSEGDPICWWALSPRMVLFPEKLHVGRSIKKSIRAQHYEIKINHGFKEVIASCAVAKRPGQDGTWILPIMQEAYCQLHKEGYAHSFEYWEEGVLMGGGYGVQIGQVFCGESMFAKRENASKIAFVHMVKYLEEIGVKMIDCQMYTEHLARFGASEISFNLFEQNLRKYTKQSLNHTIEPCVLAIN